MNDLLIRASNGHLDAKSITAFLFSFRVIAATSHEIALAHGFWEDERNNGEMIALMHSELSEALEAIRDGAGKPDSHCPEFKNVEIEFADVIIRIMDLAHTRGWDIPGALVAKLEANSQRVHRHGRRF